MAVTGPKSTKPADHEDDLLRRVRPVDWTNPVAKPLYDFTTKMAGGVEPNPVEWLGFGAAMAQMINS